MDFDLESSVAILKRTPRVVSMLLTGLGEEWTKANYGPNTWSPCEIVGHLIWGDRTDWIPRARHILQYGREQPFEPFDRAGHDALCQEYDLAELLDIFATERDESLRVLKSLQLTPEQFAMEGEHPALGVATLSQLLATWTVHDLNHIAQICKAMAFQYKPAVGPWEEYLSILAPPNPR